MVLNELVGNTTFNISETPSFYVGNEAQFKATVTVHDIEHVGYGKSKASAKSSAAEAAIRHLILKKISSSSSAASVDDDNDVKMESDEQDDSFSWSHVASFALHKLFNTWEEQGVITEKVSGLIPTPGNGTKTVILPKGDHKPSKKIPSNPETMNPVMLLNQMKPNSTFEEIGQTGGPPNVRFIYRCTVDGHSFEGTGKIFFLN